MDLFYWDEKKILFNMKAETFDLRRFIQQMLEHSVNVVYDREHHLRIVLAPDHQSVHCYPHYLK